MRRVLWQHAQPVAEGLALGCGRPRVDEAPAAGEGRGPRGRSVMGEYRTSVLGDEASRRALLENSIQHDLIIPPKLSYYPRIEDILWRNVRSARIGESAINDALAEIERRIAECVADAA